MAIWNLTRDIVVNDCPWGQIFTGPRELLIAAGLADEAHFLTEFKTVRGRRTDRQQRHGEHTIEIRKAGRQGIFEVWRHGYPPGEEKAAEQRKSEQRAAARREFLKLPKYPIGFATQLRARLAERYVGVEVSSGLHECDDGSLMQSLKFSAPLDRLIACELVTEEMVRTEWRGRHNPYRTNAAGDRYSLYGDESMAELHLFTNSSPRERPRIAVDGARKLLRRFTLSGRRLAAQ